MLFCERDITYSIKQKQFIVKVERSMDQPCHKRATVAMQGEPFKLRTKFLALAVFEFKKCVKLKLKLKRNCFKKCENFINRNGCLERNFISWQARIVEQRSIVKPGHKSEPRVTPMASRGAHWCQNFVIGRGGAAFLPLASNWELQDQKEKM